MNGKGLAFVDDVGRSRVPSLVRWAPRITRVVPVVRWALLFKHQPLLTREETERSHEAINAAWPDWRELYRKTVATRAGVPTNAVAVDEEEIVRLRYDGKTPMIDFPKVASVAGAPDPFDLRFCAALCVENFSSKLWTRIGPPYHRDAEYDVSALGFALRRYCDVAKSCGEWFHSEFVRLTRETLAGHEWLSNGALEVITVGLKIDEEPRGNDLSSWLFDSDGGPNLENGDLREFMMAATNLDYDIRELRSHEPKAFWMSIPIAVRLEKGDLVSRTALYLVRPVGEVLRVVGVGLDDSESGAFASEVALKVSRVIANQI